MTAALAGVPWQTLLAGGLVLGLLAVVGLVVRSIVRGELVPRSVLEAERAHADKWESAWRESEKRMDALDGRLDAISEGAAITNQLLSDLTTRARR